MAKMRNRSTEKKIDFEQKVQPKQLTKEEKHKAETFHAQGYAARKRGDYAQAITLYTKAIEIQPMHFKALFNRGFAYDKLGNFEKAIADYSLANEI